MPSSWTHWTSTAVTANPATCAPRGGRNARPVRSCRRARSRPPRASSFIVDARTEKRDSYFLRRSAKRGGHRCCQPVPIVRFLAQSFAAERRQLVELGSAIVLRGAPDGRQQPLAHQAEQCRIERALLDEERPS